MHDSRIVANRFLDMAKIACDTLTPMQLLKLTYIAHGWSLGLTGRALITDEVQAWKYGPVIPNLYNSTRHYRGQPVTNSIPFFTAPLKHDAESIVEQTYNKYGKLTGVQLSLLTHQEGTPWHMTYREGEFGRVIPVDLIEEYYRRMAEKQAVVGA